MVALFFSQKYYPYLGADQQMDWTQFCSEFKAGKFKRVVVIGRDLTATYGDGEVVGTNKARKTVQLTTPEMEPSRTSRSPKRKSFR